MIFNFQHYLESFTFIARSFTKGKFLLFFIPGSVIGLIYLFYYIQSLQVHEGLQVLNEIPIIGSPATWLIDNSLRAIDIVVREAYKFLVLVCLSPFNTVLSERVETELTGEKYSSSWIRIINDVLRTILIVTFALLMECVLLLFLWVISFLLPDIIGETLFFITSSFFIGFSFFDYNLERDGVGTIASWGFGFTKMGTIIISGSIFSLIYLIPVIGVIVAPVLLTIITTFVYIKMQNKKLRN